jgi:23S rRNA pseudouridine1911/1915/1917 synthase
VSETDSTRTQRLDQQVIAKQPGLSRSYASSLIKGGAVTVNGVQQTKAGYKIRETDVVDVQFDENLAELPKIDLPVLYEDDDCIVIVKPAGILSHSKGAFNPEATVASWLADKVNGLEGDRAGIVHRLDRSTSGVMICAKNPNTLSWLQEQFSARKVKKRYIAVVSGSLKQPEAIIDMPIERNPKRPQTFRAGSNGKPAITSYKVIKNGAKFSLLELSPATGRTHQLRVHLSHIGHPIKGDGLYGGQKAERLYLHAESLELTLPNKGHKIFTSAVPAEFEEAIK